MMSVTVAGRRRYVPAFGRTVITAPLRTVHDGVRTVRAAKPERASVALAGAAPDPAIGGTYANGLPRLTTSCTSAAPATFVRGSGCWRITKPCATRLL